MCGPAGCDGTVRVWDAKAGRELTRLSGHTGYVYSVAFSPDRKRIATGAERAPGVLRIEAGQVQRHHGLAVAGHDLVELLEERACLLDGDFGW